MLQVMNRFFLDKTEKNFNSIYMDLYNDLYDVSEKIILQIRNSVENEEKYFADAWHDLTKISEGAQLDQAKQIIQRGITNLC